MHKDEQPWRRIVGDEQHPTRRFFSYSFTALTLLASVVTLAPVFTQFAPQPANAGVGPVPAPAPVPVTVLSAPSVVPSDAKACKLENTRVVAKVSGYTSRVTVTQVFSNTNAKPFDAVYTFPLPDEAAVDEMTMKIGSRVIVGQIKKKEEARAIYETAKASGQTASLLEQQRTNVFTQSVANVAPHEKIEVTLKYTDILAYNHGHYEFVFPTKVGPRFTPGGVEPVSESSGYAPNSIALDVQLEGGMPIHDIVSKLHPVHFSNVTTYGAHLDCRLNKPESDFVLAWETAEDSIKTGVQVHHDSEGGYLTAMIMPPKKITPETAQPKEMIFVVDTSGSQSGAPLDKAKETLHYIVEHMNPRDTFQILSFSSDVKKFAPDPLVATAEMKRRAHEYIETLTADGGTYVEPAIEAVCSQPAPENRLRIVTLMTDGFISDDYTVIGMVKKLRNKSRWFPFGTGNSVNRNLIDNVAKEGGGEPDYILLNEDGKKIASEFYKRISNPVLTDIKVSFDGVQVEDVYPKQVADVWDQKPLYIHAKYKNGGRGTMTITGFAAGRPYKQTLPVVLPGNDVDNVPVSQTWARAKIDDLMSQDWNGMQNGTATNLKEAITSVALKHHLMSQYTSFVAVDGKKSFTTSGTSAVIAPSDSGLSAPHLQGATNGTIMPFGGGFLTGACQATLSQSFSTTVQQLNCLNSYSATTPPQVVMYPVTKVESTDDTSNFGGLQILALAVMWLASLHLLFGKKRKGTDRTLQCNAPTETYFGANEPS